MRTLFDMPRNSAKSSSQLSAPICSLVRCMQLKLTYFTLCSGQYEDYTTTIRKYTKTFWNIRLTEQWSSTKFAVRKMWSFIEINRSHKNI